MLMAKVFDFRNSKSYFFLEKLLTASPVRPSGLENPNIVIKRSKEELRALQLRELRALPNNCFLGTFHSVGHKGLLKLGIEVYSYLWTMMDKGTKLVGKLPTHATCQEQRTQAVRGGAFLSVPSINKKACCGERKVHRRKKCFR